jgi:hypothetical protein
MSTRWHEQLHGGRVLHNVSRMLTIPLIMAVTEKGIALLYIPVCSIQYNGKDQLSMQAQVANPLACDGCAL